MNLSRDISQVLQQHSGPLEVKDQDGLREYVILTKDAYLNLVQLEFRQWLQVGLDQENRGMASGWSLNDILAEAHRRFDNQMIG